MKNIKLMTWEELLKEYSGKMEMKKIEKLNMLIGTLRTCRQAKNIVGIRYWVNVPSCKKDAEEIGTEYAHELYAEIKEIADLMGIKY